MRVARYWAYGEITATAPDGVEEHRALWRGSDVSEDEARAEVARALEAAAERVRAGREKHEAGWYDYAESTRPEPLIEDLRNDEGERIAAVTLNRYGASIINTARVPFIDVDLPERGGGGGLARLFGRRKPAGDPQSEAIERLDAWVRERPARSARVYRTAAGLRYLLPATEMDPSGEEARALMERLGADERYANLCRVQGCYRARLSPKPWRIGVPSPLNMRYGREPKETGDWNETYERACAGYAVCELAAELGGAPPTPAGERVIEMHDAATKVGSGLALA